MKLMVLHMRNPHLCHGWLGNAINGLLLSLSIISLTKTVAAAPVAGQPVLSYQAQQNRWALPLQHGDVLRVNHSAQPLALKVSAISASEVTLTVYSLTHSLATIEDIFSLPQPVGQLHLFRGHCQVLESWGVTALSVEFAPTENQPYHGESLCSLNSIP